MTKNFLKRKSPYFLRQYFDTDPYQFYEWRKKHVAECFNARDYLKNRLTDSLTKDEKRIIRGMVRDLKHVAEWLMKMEDPESVAKHGAEKYRKDRRNKSMDNEELGRALMDQGLYEPDPSDVIVEKILDKHWKESIDYSYHAEQFLGMLTNQQREVFELKYVACWTEKEIAEYIGTSGGNVWNILRAIEKKRKKFVAEFGDGLIL